MLASMDDECLASPDGSGSKWTASSYLYGNMPAIDLLNLKENEGLETNRDYKVLFAASGDIRNLVKTVLGLPDKYTGTFTAMLNDRDLDVAARNTILLFIAHMFLPEVAVPMMIHMWYSTSIPSSMLHQMRDRILPAFRQACEEFRSMPSGMMYGKYWPWINQQSSVTLYLVKEQWPLLEQYLSVPNKFSLPKAKAARQASTLCPARRDVLDHLLYRLPFDMRVPTMKFREEGVVLPFGASRAEFDIPNPSLFTRDGAWLLGGNLDPHDGWSFDDIMAIPYSIKNDRYGRLFYYLQDQLYKFCERLRTFKIKIQLTQIDTIYLTQFFERLPTDPPSFDRIETSNIADENYLGLETTLSALSLLLKPTSVNPHATPLTLFISATVLDIAKNGDGKKASQKATPWLKEHLGLDCSLDKSNKTCADWQRGCTAVWYFFDSNKAFERVMKKVGNPEDLDLVAKKEHSIVPQWPLRLPEKPTKEEFLKLERSYAQGFERYIEWQRTV